MRCWKHLLLSLVAALGMHARAAEVAVPPALEPWRSWVLDQHRDLACPPHYASLGERYCRWPGQLLLEADQHGARFQQDWQLYGDSWVTLPGDAEHWPQAVQVNDRTVAVSERDGQPAIRLPAGEHRISGQLQWEQLPTRLPLPEDSGLLALTLQGKPVAQPAIDSQGRLLFGENRAPATVADSLSVQVFRLLEDDIPLQLETVVRFRVAGRDRELLLGQLLLDGFVPLALDSPLPARIETDGRLRVQLRAGEWQVRLRARADGQPLQFSSRPLDEHWPAEELWSLHDNRSLRQITLTGAASIDPSQTDMPPEWRQWPAWLLRPGEQLALTEHQRGDTPGSAAAGETLSLVRDLWLDFDGSGITSRDLVRGVLKQAARFSTASGQQLGRAEVNGEPQLITRLDGQPGEAGLELRPGPLRLLGLSRLADSHRFSATGWQRDFSRVSATLHLPPGWMLLHAAGTDSAAGSWLTRWNLWAIFLVLIVAATSWRLLGASAGAIALLALLLTYHSPSAPVFLWLAALIAVALLRALPAGRLRRWIHLASAAVFVALLLMLLNFAVDQARRSLYPQLELGRYSNIQQRAVSAADESEGDAAMESPAAAPAQEMLMSAELAEQKMADNSAYQSLPRKAQVLRKLKTGYDSGAKVQTGPGEPAWQWQQVQLHWSGPVAQDQSLQLYLLSPAWHRLWNVASVALVLLFAARLLRAAYPGNSWRTLPGHTAATAVLGALLLLPAPPVVAQAVASGFPDPALLAELEQRLTRLPDCEPQCAALHRGQLLVDSDTLRLELQIDAQVAVAVPLPAIRNQWQPRTVLVDGDSASLRRDPNGLLWAALPSGSHRLLLEGPVSGDSLQLPFEMPVHNLAVSASGWQVSGLANGQVPGRSLQLTREAQVTRTDTQLLPDAAPAFLRVTRTLVLGLDWQVQTRVDRLAPASGAITVPVTLLPGESVLTAGVEVRDGKAMVIMSANSHSFAWQSGLKQGNALQLTAAQPAPWVERWQFDIAPIWHVAFSGLNPVKLDMQDGQLPLWQPWPGESLALAISRPEAVQGNTRTVESAALDYRPGARSGEASLTLAVRSSQGGELPLALPPASQLQRVSIDGVEQSNPADGNTLRLPLRPGHQQITVSWLQDHGIQMREFTPLPQLDEPLSNIALKMQLPQGRWLLAVGGPAMGPALLFWGVLVVIMLVAIGLGRSRVAPVATWQWLLLGIGMSTVNSAGSILVVLWFVAMAWRATLDTRQLSRSRLQLLQVGLVGLTLLALGSLVGTIPMSLLSTPDMQVAGNQSSAWSLQWYQDRTVQGLPQAWALSLPMWVYRAAMLAWSLWLVFALLGWCRWGWQCFTTGEWWRSPAPVKPVPTPAAETAATGPVTQPEGNSNV